MGLLNQVARAEQGAEADYQQGRPKYEQLVAVLGGHPLEDSASFLGLESRAAADAVAEFQRQYHALAARSMRGLAEHQAWIGRQLHDNRRRLRAYEEATVEAEVAEGLPEDQRTQVTGKSLEELAATQDRGRGTAQTVLAMRKMQRRRLHGMTLAAIRRHPAYLDARRRQRQINPVVTVRRANPRSGRPGGQPRRQTTRSGADSGDSGDEGPSEAAPPQLADARRRRLHSFECSTCPTCGHVLLFAEGELLCPEPNCVSWGRSTPGGDAR